MNQAITDEQIDLLIDAKLVHEIHTSERRSFRACRRRWDWAFNEAYYPNVTAKPLEFGVAYHEAMEIYYDPAWWDTDREVRAALAIKKFVDTCEAQRKAALESHVNLTYDDDVEMDYDERVELGKGMLSFYFNEVAPVEDKGWRPVKVEVGFMILIPNPETGESVIWCKCDNCQTKINTYRDTMKGKEECIPPALRLILGGLDALPVVYAGRLDMLAEDLTHKGNYYIFDWKTARAIPDNHDFLYLDDQVASYVWALSELGLNVRGFVYHEQRKGFPSAPKKNKQRRLGCLFSVAKNQDTDYDKYLATVKAEDREAYEEGAYDEFLEYLKTYGVKYFERTKIVKAKSELAQIAENIGYEALDMIDQSLRIYPSPGRFGCQFCAFQTPCIEKNSGGDWEYTLDSLFERREHYYLRKDASTESKSGE